MTSQLSLKMTKFVLCIFSKTTHRRNAIKKFWGKYKQPAFVEETSATILTELTMQQHILF